MESFKWKGDKLMNGERGLVDRSFSGDATGGRASLCASPYMFLCLCVCVLAEWSTLSFITLGCCPLSCWVMYVKLAKAAVRFLYVLVKFSC